jgi:hypothetical protein
MASTDRMRTFSVQHWKFPKYQADVPAAAIDANRPEGRTAKHNPLLRHLVRLSAPTCEQTVSTSRIFSRHATGVRLDLSSTAPTTSRPPAASSRCGEEQNRRHLARLARRDSARPAQWLSPGRKRTRPGKGIQPSAYGAPAITHAWGSAPSSSRVQSRA